LKRGAAQVRAIGAEHPKHIEAGYKITHVQSKGVGRNGCGYHLFTCYTIHDQNAGRAELRIPIHLNIADGRIGIETNLGLVRTTQGGASRLCLQVNTQRKKQQDYEVYLSQRFKAIFISA